MSIVEETLKEELQKRLVLSTKYKSELENAKTPYKREYYTKKLHKNNQVIYSLLEAFERVTNKKKETSDEAVSDPEPSKDAE